MAKSLRRRLHIPLFGTISPEGTGTVTTKDGTFLVKLKITKAFPKGALYDEAGRAFDWPARAPKEEKPLEEFMGEADAFSDAQTASLEG